MRFIFKRRTSRLEREHYHANKEIARQIIHERLNHYGAIFGVSWNTVKIRCHRSRWGSCSKLGNLNFNYKMMFLPGHLFDYIIVHELCHLKQFNHSQHFWREVSTVLPDYRHLITELRHIERMTGLSPEKLHYYTQQTYSRPFDP